MTLPYRTTDHDPSRLAAKSHEGAAVSNRTKILAVLSMRDGCTSGEIAKIAGLERHESARRMSELERAKKITRGLSRKCEACGTTQTTWWIVRAWKQES